MTLAKILAQKRLIIIQRKLQQVVTFHAIMPLMVKREFNVLTSKGLNEFSCL